MHSADAALGPAGRRVARYITQNRADVLASSARDLAAKAGTSDATVIRTVQALGFASIAALKQALLDSLRQTPADDMRRTLATTGGEVGDAIALVIETHRAALDTLRAPDSQAQIAAAVVLLHRTARIVTFGIGPSAALADYAALQLQRSGRRSLALTATGLRLADALLDLRPGDAVLALAYGRSYREVLTLFAEARRLGLPVVLITDSLRHVLAAEATLVLTVPRGQAQHVALHGTTLIALEALALGLAAAGPDAALATLDRLNALRTAASGQRTPVGEETARTPDR